MIRLIQHRNDSSGSPPYSKTIVGAAIALVGGLFLFASHSAVAATESWTGATNGLWGTNTNWSASTTPTLSDDLIILGPSNLAAALNINVAAAANANSINFTDTAAVTLTNTTSGADQTLTIGAGLTTGTGAVTIGSTTANQGVLIALNGSQTWNIGAGGLTANNIISGSGINLTKLGSGTLTTVAADTYSGTTTIGASGSTTNAGIVTVSGTAGSIKQSSGIAVYGIRATTGNGNGSTLNLDYTATGAQAVDRVGDAATVALGNGGELILVGNATASTATTETIGALQFTNGSGVVTLNASGASGTSLKLTAANASNSIIRTNSAIGLIRAANSLGVNATVVGKLQLGDGGASMGLVGTTAANNLAAGDATLNLKISNFLFGDTGVGGHGTTFVTYDSGLGTVRALTTTEFVSTIGAAINNDQNVRVTATASSIASNTINSLLCSQSGAGITLTGAGGGSNVLTINSGVIYSQAGQSTGISGFDSIVLKNGEGVIGTVAADNFANASATTISSPITITNAAGTGNSGMLTKFGGGVLNLTATENYTGQTNVNQGTLSIGNGTTDGDISASSNIVLNSSGNITFNRVANLTTGQVISGTGSVSKSGAGALTLSGTNTYTGATNFPTTNGGTLVITGSISNTSSVTIGSGGGAAVLQVNTTATNPLGTGLISLDGTGNASTARLELNTGSLSGGSVTLPNAISFPARTQATNFTDGIRNVSGNNTLSGLITMIAGGANYTIQSDAGLLTISNSMTNALTGNRFIFLQGAGNGLFSGVISNGTSTATPSLTKNGAGTWSLSNTNTYNSTTTINGGTLQLSGTGSINASTGITISGTGAKFLQTSSVASTPAITLTSGTVDGTGSVGTTTVASSASNVIANGNNNTVSTALTLSSLTFSGSGAFNFTLAGGATTSPAIIVTNALQTNGTASVALNATILSPMVNATTYHLIQYGSFSGNLTDFVKNNFGGISSRQLVFANDTVNKFINVTYSSTPGNVTWTGADDNTWAPGLNGTNKNWKYAGNPTDYLEGDDVVFDDSATGSTSINITSNVAPSTMTFNNGAKNYDFSGSQIVGLGTLTKNGAGAVTLATSNTYTGGTSLNSGTLNINNASAIGTGTLTIAGGAIDNTNGGTQLTTNNAESWTGDFTFVGTNDLYLGTGAVALSGATRTVTLNASRLTVGALNGGTTTALVVNGGGSLAIASSTIAGLSGNGKVENNSNAAATLTVNQASNTTFSGILQNGTSNTFALTKLGSGALTLSGTSTYSGGTVINAGTIIAKNTSALGSGNIQFQAGSTGTLDIALDAATDLSNTFGTNSVSTVTLQSDVLTPGAGTNHTLGTSVLGGGSITIMAGPNVSGGSPSLSLGAVQLTAGSTQTTTFNPTTASVTLDSVNNNSNQTHVLELGGSNANNVITNNIFVTQGTLSLLKSGTSTWTLLGNSTYNSTTTISGGTLNIGNGGTTGTLGGTSVTNNGTIGFNRSDNVTVSVAISGTGNIIKNNASTLVLANLSGTNALTVNAGTLNVTGTAGAMTVANLGSATLENGGTGTSTLSGASLSFLGAGQATVHVSAPSSTAGISVSGALSTTPANGSVTLNAYNPSWTAGTYNLIGFGSFGGANTDFTLGTLTGGSASRVVAGAPILNGSNVAIVVNVDTPKWTGALSSEWSTATLSAPKNWKLITSGNTTDYIDGDAVLFDDSATGTTTVDISAGSVSPGATAFNNSTKNYTLTNSSSSIAGTGALTKSGTGTLTINNANTYTGGTTLGGGTLNLGNSQALGNGTFTITTGNPKTIDNTSGSAPLTLTGVTSQAWNDSFTFTGTNDLDMGTGNVTLGGATDITATISAGKLIVGEIHDSGTHGLIKKGNTGTLVVTSVGAGNTGSVIAGTLDVEAGTLQINRDGTSGTTSGDFTAAGLTGSGTIVNGAGDERWLFVGSAANSTFSGALQNGTGGGALGLNKQGTGTLTLTGSSTYSGTTTVATGILNVQNSNALGTSHVTAVSRAGGIQLQGGISIPNSVTFLLSNDGTGAIPYAVDNVSDNNTINGTITMTSGGGSPIIQSDAGALTLAGNITSDQARTLTLQGASTGANTVSGVISNGSAGTNGLTKNGVGTWILTNSNSYSAGTTINAGTVVVKNTQALGSGNVQFPANSTGTLDIALDAGNDLSNTFGTNTTSTITLQSDVLTPGAGINHALGTATLGGGSITIAAGPNVSGGSPSLSIGTVSMTAGSTQTTTFNPTTATAFLGSVTNNSANTHVLELGGTNSGNAVTGSISVAQGALSVLKSGASTWTLSGNNTYAGGTTVNDTGTLVVGSVTALGSGGLTINGGVAQLQAGLSAPVQLTSLTIAGGSSLPADFSSNGFADPGLAATNGWLNADDLGSTDFAQQGSSLAGGGGSPAVAGVTPVPEPSSLMLITLGVVGLGAGVYRRRRTS